MKKFCIAMALILVVTVPLSIMAAEDGAALFKTKCANCHGAGGEGKTATKMPAVKGTALTADQIVELLTKGTAERRVPHKKPTSGFTADQAKAVADYVKTLK